MKIGIITQPLRGNYGGLLQNYALQEILIQLGHQPITLELMSIRSGLKNIIYQINNFTKYIFGKSPYPILPYAPYRSNIKIKKFVKDHINTSNTLLNSFPMQLIKKLDLGAIIVGSDQVWRPKYNASLTDMYLKFCHDKKVRKIAYAASFGTSEFEYNEVQCQECANLLSKFHSVSVREKTGLNILRKLNFRHGVQVLDPTLLLGKAGFDKLLLDNINTTEEPYLGCYVLDNDEKLNDIIQIISVNNNLYKIKRFGENTYGFGPLEWITAIKNAQLFVTDSFHGTVFCLLYHVPFFSFINSNRGADRFLSLLEPLGLLDRLISDISDCDKRYSHIDWNKVDNTLNNYRNNSLSFLKNSLQTFPKLSTK